MNDNNRKQLVYEFRDDAKRINRAINTLFNKILAYDEHVTTDLKSSDSLLNNLLKAQLELKKFIDG